MRVMKRIAAVRMFFKQDPLGQKIIEQFQDLLSIAREGRMRLRKRIGQYLKKLEDEA